MLQEHVWMHRSVARIESGGCITPQKWNFWTPKVDFYAPEANILGYIGGAEPHPPPPPSGPFWPKKWTFSTSPPQPSNEPVNAQCSRSTQETYSRSIIECIMLEEHNSKYAPGAVCIQILLLEHIKHRKLPKNICSWNIMSGQNLTEAFVQLFVLLLHC